MYIFATIVASLLYKAVPPLFKSSPPPFRSSYYCRAGYNRVYCYWLGY